ncbi:uncharacterized protein LOC126299027 isoform X2 [Schistocerca gregaria]|uniref:uncharacterized protein LOC126299027 isoform X2 n=1 Tax=Schistocerca gregaria TaxID=7010 RepID=UPI00211E797E|nr:uncharacterized protein LOC126299027 isoform X2 [Schistocerca gregaria]
MSTMVKWLVREFAVDTPHWRQLIFPICLAVAFRLSQKICEKYLFQSHAASRNVKTPWRHRLQQLEVLDSASKAIADIIRKLTGQQIKFSHGERSRTVKVIRSWWFFVYYIQSCIFAYCIVQKELWMWDTRLWWLQLPISGCNNPVLDVLYDQYGFQLVSGCVRDQKDASRLVTNFIVPLVYNFIYVPFMA